MKTQPTHTPTTTPGCHCKVREIEGFDQIVFCDLHVRAVNAYSDLVYACRLALSDGAIENEEVIDMLHQALALAEEK